MGENFDIEIVWDHESDAKALLTKLDGRRESNDMPCADYVDFLRGIATLLMEHAEGVEDSTLRPRLF